MAQTKAPLEARGVRWAAIAGVLALAIASGMTASGALFDRAHVSPQTPSAKPEFSEIAWKMGVDQWGPGRAYVCDAEHCGAEVRLYARTKSGFCNCYKGVADDTEIDRIGDVDIHGEDFSPLADGRVTALGELAGRQRNFLAWRHNAPKQHVLAIVVAEDCKAVVATLVARDAISEATEQAARAALTGESFRRWAAARD
mgnify:CR=1 FL=1|jgi:hypothetical protein